MTPDLSVVGIDIAKRIFHLVGTDDRGKVVLRKRWWCTFAMRINISDPSRAV